MADPRPISLCRDNDFVGAKRPSHAAFHLDEGIDMFAAWPAHARRTAKALFSEIKTAGYEGCYSRVTDFIREWRAGEGMSVSKNACDNMKTAVDKVKKGKGRIVNERFAVTSVFASAAGRNAGSGKYNHTA